MNDLIDGILKEEFLKKIHPKIFFFFGKERKILSFLRNFKIARIPLSLCKNISREKFVRGSFVFTKVEKLNVLTESVVQLICLIYCSSLFIIDSEVSSYYTFPEKILFR